MCSAHNNAYYEGYSNNCQMFYVEMKMMDLCEMVNG